MLKSIVAAVLTALKTVFSCARKVVSLPLRMLDAILGGGVAGAPIEIPEVAAPEVVKPSEPVDKTRMYEDIATAVMTWCAESIIRNAPAPVLTFLPLGIRQWLPGLTRAECDAIIDADKIRVSAHLQRLFPLRGVRPVQPLKALREWPPAPKPMVALETEGFAATAAGYGLAPYAAAE